MRSNVTTHLFNERGVACSHTRQFAFQQTSRLLCRQSQTRLGVVHLHVSHAHKATVSEWLVNCTIDSDSTRAC
jgi:hypothetical protein